MHIIANRASRPPSARYHHDLRISQNPHANCHHQTIMANSRFSVLDLAPVREGGSIAETYRNSLDLARHAEKWGFTRFWLAEHHNMPGIASAATSVLIGHIAAGTSTIRVGSGGVMLPNHSSLVIAEQFGTLESLFPGRIDLGVGRAPGSDGVAARALGYNTVEAEFPRQLQDLLDYLGPAVPGQRLTAYPGVGTNVPVWLLGSSTYSARLAAQLGLPFAFASHFAPVLLDEALEIYRTEFKPSKHLATSYAIAGVPLVAAESDAEARKLSTSALQRHLRLIRGKAVYVPAPVESMEGLWTPAEQFAVESRLDAAAIGGPETLRRRLAEFLERTKADELMFVSDLYDHERRLRSFEIAAGVMKSFAQEPVAAATAERP
jgi:luciferase family oxidoreductase group 1